MIRYTLAIGAWLACMAAASAEGSLPLIGWKVVLTRPSLGCRETSDVEAVFKLMSENDREAAVKYVQDKKGACKFFEQSTIATVKDLSVLHNMSCNRPAGSPYCFWMFPQTVSRQAN